MKFPAFTVDFQPLLVIVNTIGAKIMKMLPGEVGRMDLKVQCEFRKEAEKGQYNIKSKMNTT